MPVEKWADAKYPSSPRDRKLAATATGSFNRSQKSSPPSPGCSRGGHRVWSCPDRGGRRPSARPQAGAIDTGNAISDEQLTLLLRFGRGGLLLDVAFHHAIAVLHHPRHLLPHFRSHLLHHPGHLLGHLLRHLVHHPSLTGAHHALIVTGRRRDGSLILGVGRKRETADKQGRPGNELELT